MEALSSLFNTVSELGRQKQLADIEKSNTMVSGAVRAWAETMQNERVMSERELIGALDELSKVDTSVNENRKKLSELGALIGDAEGAADGRPSSYKLIREQMSKLGTEATTLGDQRELAQTKIRLVQERIDSINQENDKVLIAMNAIGKGATSPYVYDIIQAAGPDLSFADQSSDALTRIREQFQRSPDTNRQAFALDDLQWTGAVQAALKEMGFERSVRIEETKARASMTQANAAAASVQNEKLRLGVDGGVNLDALKFFTEGLQQTRPNYQKTGEVPVLNEKGGVALDSQDRPIMRDTYEDVGGNPFLNELFSKSIQNLLIGEMGPQPTMGQLNQRMPVSGTPSKTDPSGLSSALRSQVIMLNAAKQQGVPGAAERLDGLASKSLGDEPTVKQNLSNMSNEELVYVMDQAEKGDPLYEYIVTEYQEHIGKLLSDPKRPENTRVEQAAKKRQMTGNEAMNLPAAVGEAGLRIGVGVMKDKELREALMFPQDIRTTLIEMSLRKKYNIK